MMKMQGFSCKKLLILKYYLEGKSALRGKIIAMYLKLALLPSSVKCIKQ
jgi:hypothetical protein